MITLFGNVESGNDHKVRLLLSFRGLDYRRVEVSQTRDEPRHPAFLALNPIGKIPAVLLPDGRVLSESGAILYYLASGTPYWPKDEWSRAECLRWMFFEQYSHEPAIAVNRYWRCFAPADVPDDARLADNHDRGLRALGAMEAHLRTRRWFTAERATIADIALFPYTRVADEGGFDLTPFPRIRDWIDRFEALDGCLDLRDDPGALPAIGFDEYFACAAGVAPPA